MKISAGGALWHLMGGSQGHLEHQGIAGEHVAEEQKR